MAEERVLLPAPFRGLAQEDPAEFWRRLQNYAEYKGLDPVANLRLAKAMLTEEACDWLEKLPIGAKDTMDHLAEAFKTRFIRPPVLRFKSACELFGKRQGNDESVDAYASRLRGLSKRVEVNDDTLLYAFVSGLKPKIASFVLGKNPATVQAAIDDARIAEMSLLEAEGADNGQIANQLTEMRKDISRMAQRYDSLAISAPMQQARDRSKSPVRRVSFSEPTTAERPQRPATAQGGTNYSSFNRGGYRGYPQSRGRFRGRARGSRGNFAPSRTFVPNPPVPYMPQNEYQAMPPPGWNMPSPNPQAQGPAKCHKCGFDVHENILYCPANNQQCLYCGKYGHYRRCCRQAKTE